MAKSDRVENPTMREYLYQFVPEQTNGNALFVKKYGDKFTSKMMKENVLVVYSNEPYSVKGTAAYHNSGEKSITFCCDREVAGNLLTPEEVAKDKELQEIAVHESIHAILERTEKECKLYNIYGGTGLLERYYSNGRYSELGRGLNEGFTEWLCEKLGFKPRAYTELTNFVRLIEVAIGTEKTMELGKGGIRDNFPRILSMSEDEVSYILAMADQVYNANDRITTASNLRRVLQKCIYDQKNDGKLSEKSQKEFEYNLTTITEYLKDPVFLNYAKTHEKDPTEECLVEYLKEVSIKEYEEQRNLAVISFESFVLNRFFINDLQQIFSNETISDENFEKLTKINSILNTKVYEIPDSIKKLTPPMAVVLFKDEYKKATERYVKQLAVREAEKYKKGELGLKQFVEKDKQISETNSRLSEMLFQEFVKLVAPDNEEALLSILNSAYKYSDKEEYLKQIANASIYQLKSEDSEMGLKSTLVFDNENLFDRYQITGDSITSIDDRVKFDFTASMEGEQDEYKITMENFLKLQKEVFIRNPNAKIHIASREVVVQEGNELKFYKINEGQLVPMVVEKKQDLQFVYQESTQMQEQPTAMVPVKVSFWSALVNKFKRRANDRKNKGKAGVPNYIDDSQIGKIVFDVPETNKIDSYRVDNFDKMLAQKQQSQGEQKTIHTQKNDQEKES